MGVFTMYNGRVTGRVGTRQLVKPTQRENLAKTKAVVASHICFRDYIFRTSSLLQYHETAQVKSDHARIRFESRERRLLLKKQQEDERRRLKREALQKKKAGSTASSADPVQAALERVKARKQIAQEEST